MLNLKGKDLGRYHLIEPLGEGGMAMVYKAFDASLDRNVAIKVIRTEMGGDPSFLQRFQREAKALARLDHPYILKVLDYGEQDGVPYLVMPFVAGGTLKARMGQPIAPAETARILAPIARALAYAHSQGIIHRDVKPANILITPSGAPTLSDFGIAKMLEGEGKTQLTATGVGMGTPDYMAPEQWLGTTDARTDVYALGVILFQMVTGRLPYSADTPAAVLLKHMQDPLPRPGDFVPGLAEAVERVIFKALAKEPAERFQTMDAFAEALERLAAGVNQSPDVTMAAPPRGVQPAAYTGQSTDLPRQAPAAYTGQSTDLPRQAPAAYTGQSTDLPRQAPAAYTGQSTDLPRQAPGAAAPRTAPPAYAPAPAKKSMPWLAIGGGALALLVVFCLAAALVVMRIRANRLNTGPEPTSPPLLAAAPPEEPTLAAEAPVSEPSATAVEAVAAAPEATAPPGETPGSATAEALFEPAPDLTPTRLPPITKIEGLPDDIPILKENNGDLMTQQSADMTMYMYTTTLSTAEAANFFKKEMARLGWTIQNTTTMEAQGAVMYVFEKNARMVMINIAGADGKTMVMVQLVPQSPGP